MPKKRAVSAQHAEPSVKLSSRGAARLEARHPWVYRSDIVGDKEIPPGSIVRVFDPRGKFLGTALYSSSSQIAIRMISHGSVADLPALVAERIRAAIAYRKELVSNTDAYRIVFSEADFLPGLIIDRYSDVISLQILTQAMDVAPVREAIVETLRQIQPVWGWAPSSVQVHVGAGALTCPAERSSAAVVPAERSSAAVVQAERTGAPVKPGVGLAGWSSSAVAGGHGDPGFVIAKDSDPKNVSLLKKISSGPGRLTAALEITRERDNGKSLVSPRSDLQIVDDGYRVRRVPVTPRIGIAKSAERPLRYIIAGNPFVSGRRA